jgi:hypothetical protein
VSEVTFDFPPWALAILEAINNPNPNPSFIPLEVSREKGSKTVLIIFVGIGSPEFDTLNLNPFKSSL